MNPVLMQEMQAVLKAIIRKEISSKVAIGSTVLTVDEHEIIVKIRSLQKYEKSIQKIINKSEGKQSSNVVSEWHDDVGNDIFISLLLFYIRSNG